jgi:WD40 repeat protein
MSKPKLPVCTSVLSNSKATSSISETFIQLPHKGTWVEYASFSHNGEKLATCSADQVYVWSIHSSSALRPFSLELKVIFDHPDNVWKTIFSNPSSQALGDDKLITVCSDGKFYVWDIKNKCAVYNHRVHLEAHPVFGCVFHPYLDILVTCSRDKTICVFDLRNKKPITILKGHNDIVEDVDISPDGNILSSCSKDRRVCLWFNAFNTKCEENPKKKLLLGHKHWVFSVKFSPDGQLLASSSADKNVGLWSVYGCQLLHFLCGHTNVVWRTCFLTWMQEPVLASCSSDKTVRYVYLK